MQEFALYSAALDVERVGWPSSVPTIARILQENGYRTALSGKWHLGTVDGCRPADHGFDEWFGFLAGLCRLLFPTFTIGECRVMTRYTIYGQMIKKSGAMVNI